MEELAASEGPKRRKVVPRDSVLIQGVGHAIDRQPDIFTRVRIQQFPIHVFIQNKTKQNKTKQNKKSPLLLEIFQGTWLGAQVIEHVTLDLKGVSLSTTWDVQIT